VTVCYETCLPTDTTPVLILTITLFGSGITAQCTYLSVEPHPEDPTVQSLDCDGNSYSMTSYFAIVNPNSGCYCTVANAESGGQDKPRDGSAASTAHFCTWVPVERNTWGAIKSLYR